MRVCLSVPVCACVSVSLSLCLSVSLSLFLSLARLLFPSLSRVCNFLSLAFVACLEHYFCPCRSMLAWLRYSVLSLSCRKDLENRKVQLESACRLASPSPRQLRIAAENSNLGVTCMTVWELIETYVVCECVNMYVRMYTSQLKKSAACKFFCDCVCMYECG